MPDHPNGTTQPDAIPGLGLPAQRRSPGAEGATPDPTAEAPDDARPSPVDPPPAADPETARWSLTSLLVLAVAAVLLASATVWHLGTVFLSIAPSNTISQKYQAQINSHVYPEFEQNWQLFAPNPLQDNIAVEARVQTLTPGGTRPQSGWIGLTAQDTAHIRHNPAPSHADQNQLRRAWDYYTAWHNQQDETSLGLGGPLSREYLKRIALQRFGRDWQGNQIIQIQFRAATTPLAGPSWTGAAHKPQTSYRTLPWWAVSDDDYTGLQG